MAIVSRAVIRIIHAAKHGKPLIHGGSDQGPNTRTRISEAASGAR